MADLAFPLTSVERILGINGRGIVIDEVLHEPVRTKERVRHSGVLDVVLGLGVQARKSSLASAHGGEFHHMLHFRLLDLVHGLPLQGSQFLSWRADQEHPFHTLQSRTNRLRLVVVHDCDFYSGGSTRYAAWRLERRTHLDANMCHLLENFFADVATCASNQNHDDSPWFFEKFPCLSVDATGDTNVADLFFAPVRIILE